MNNILTESIDITTLTLADWLKIASAAEVNNPCKWAYYRWSQNTNLDLSTLSIDDWEAIGEECEFAENWAYFQYKENRKS